MSPVRRWVVGVTVAAVAILATAVPASAHDALVHSTPQAGERLDAAPEKIVLTFSGELLMLGESTTGAVVLVIDEDGRDWAGGDVEVEGNTVTVDVKPGMPDSGYQVRWQVVSEDGHPISGIVPFTVGDAEPMASQDAGGGQSTTNAEDPGDQTTQEPSGAPRALLIGGGGAVIAVAAFALYRFLRRPRTAVAVPENDGTAEREL
ncbi:copper resistance protein CopC [Microbacterium sp. SSW1-49]|uniref:Copper resistance protein CopC n=1 Tax=Microbacterium croceum TaxID=2851645 RepID=A0ABT0FCF3_9MICO|nr:copper resistance CopC family protein [Microbacterium croceum]MCK2035751.1 copper resistance protein CopC [Microbacterium croceum]